MMMENMQVIYRKQSKTILENNQRKENNLSKAIIIQKTINIYYVNTLNKKCKK